MTTAGQDSDVTAGIYCRISLAAIGDTVKVDDQQRICRDLAGQLGWEVGDSYGHPLQNGVYTDNSRSAWQKNRKRPAWNQMLEDVKAGKINGIVVYHGDRLVRRPEDLADLMRLADSKGVKLASPTGTYNLDKNRLELWVRAAFAEEESQRASERRQSQYERWRREGRVRPGGRGGRSFGFETDGITRRPADRCILATRHLESETDVIREAAARILDGESAGSVARDIAGRGWDGPAGSPMDVTTLKRMLMRPRMAGLMPDGESKAAWEPVIDRDTWERLRLVLSARAAKYGSTANTRKYLLTGIAVCGGSYPDGTPCGGPVKVNRQVRGGAVVTGYACRDGCRKVYRSVAHLDAYVSERVIARLNNPLNPEGHAMPVDHAAEWATLERERGETEATARKYVKSAGRLAILMERLDQIDERMTELRELAADGARSALLERYRGITREQWENDLTLDVRRALVSACFAVTVLPASGRGPGFRPQDVRVEPLS